MNLILEKTNQVRYFTDMEKVFAALKIQPKDYDWYVSDVETNGQLVEEGWYEGQELERCIVGKNIQFIWGVFSAFPLGGRFEVTDPPYCGDNPNYWNGTEPAPQLEGALFEIACWDSSATILIGVSNELGSNFVSIYTDTIELTKAAR